MLDDILDHKRRELEHLADVEVRELPACAVDFRRALSGPELSIIAEVKRRSPSAGVLASGLDPVAQARAYVEGKAAAISVLTDGRYFGGSFDDLSAVARAVYRPVLCKEFILDERQVRHARLAGASACLLIVAALSDDELRRLLAEVRRFNMEALVEVHDEAELERAVACGADIIGVNNRNLRTMEVDMTTVPRMAPRVPDRCLLVAESGYRNADDLLVLPRRVDAVLIGTALMQGENPAATLRQWVDQLSRKICGTTSCRGRPVSSVSGGKATDQRRVFGGLYVPEPLVEPLRRIGEAFQRYRDEPGFCARLDRLLKDYAGRPTPLYFSQKLTQRTGRRIYLKREDLLHLGAHKTNNTIGQGLLAHVMGKRRLIAETGAGQHGVATAMAGALFGIPVEIFMGSVDIERQAMNVFRMKLMGAKVHPVNSGSATLKDAINDALRDWIANAEDTYYLFGTAAGPEPFPEIVTHFQSVIGREARAQVLEAEGRLPDAVIACVGGGSNAIGIFHDFITDESVRLLGAEAGGDGVRHGASLSSGSPGVFHGMYSYFLQDSDGQIAEAHSIAAGLDYPGVGPEHAQLWESGRARYYPVRDDEALSAFHLLAGEEGIIPALESAHAVALAMKIAGDFPEDSVLLVNLSGRGDKDLHTVMNVAAQD